MSFANFGIGVGALAKGINQGMTLGRQIKSARNENEINDIRTEGLQAAQDQRKQDINSRVEGQGLRGAPDTGFMSEAASGFKVGDQSFKTRDSAKEAASGDVGGVMDYFMRDTAPKIAERYVAQGDIEKAEAWNTWVKDRRSQQAVEQWGKSYTAAQTGDWDSAAKGFGEYYTNFINDNVDYVGHETLSDGDGNVTGFNITLKDNDTGKNTQMPLNVDQLVNLGMSQNPQQLFESAYQQQVAASQQRAEVAAGDREAARDYQYESRGAERDQQYSLEEITAREQAKSAYSQDETNQDYQANVNILKGAGFSDAQIRDLTPRILGISNTRAAASDTDLRSTALKTLTDDYMGRREFNALSPEEQEEKISALVEVIKGSRGQEQSRPPSNASEPARGGVNILFGDGTETTY